MSRTVYEPNKTNTKLDNLSDGQLIIMDAIADLYESVNKDSESESTTDSETTEG